MQIRYYFSWFENGFPSNLTDSIKRDLTERKSLVMISGNPEETFQSDFLIKKWFDQAGIFFDKYEIINKESSKSEVINLLNNASVIFLCGGYPKKQNKFLIDYGLFDVIKVSQSIIMGASAGAMNMSSQWLSSINTDQKVKKSSIINGIGLDNFYFCTKANQSISDGALLKELLPMSVSLDIYMPIGESAIRIENSQTDIYGNVYIISNGTLDKLRITF